MDFFSPQSLLKKPCPTFRAAYSDRTAWLMSEMSKLAYFRFEFDGQDMLLDFAKRFSGLTDITKIKSLLEELVRTSIEKTTLGKEALAQILKQSGFELIQTFNAEGTQAFLCKRTQDNIAILAFRGTEARKIRDIKTDLNAILSKEEKGSVHSGFQQAFKACAKDITCELSKLPDIPLYITGHSLGGALAIVATQNLESDRIAACYTFGSPRVGNYQFSEEIKTPIYRVVNTSDIVPRMPPGLAIELSVDALRFVSSLIPFVNKIATWLDDRVSGYRHYGDMRYLTLTKKADFSDVTVIPNITPLDRWRRLFKSRVSFNRYLKDHSIDIYSKKLASYALKRQKGTETAPLETDSSCH